MAFVLRNSVHNIVTLFQLLEKSWNFRRRVLQVVVYGHNNLVFRRANTTQQCIVLPNVPHQIDPMNPRSPPREIRNSLPTLIRTRVVHQNQFETGCAPGQHRFQFFHQQWQSR